MTQGLYSFGDYERGPYKGTWEPRMVHDKHEQGRRFELHPTQRILSNLQYFLSRAVGTFNSQGRTGTMIPYDFRHSILMHKTTVPNWDSMKKASDRYLKCRGRDIQLVPIQFLYHEPEMLRQYGGRILMFNMHRAETGEALSTARETDNGYIQVSQHISG